ELKQLIQTRETQLKNEMSIASQNYDNARAEGVPFDPREIGFDISLADMADQRRAIERKQAVQKG
ncbi:MAG: hypothetical protein WA324_07780, partial [Bryobacteraceae bacterium]